MPPTSPGEQPAYNSYDPMDESRGPMAAQFAAQVLDTTRAFRSVPDADLDVLDLGCGYGHTALELARRCRSVHGMEPTSELAAAAARLAAESGLPHFTAAQGGTEDLTAREAYDLVVLDNVYEHLPAQRDALQRIVAALRPGGVLFLLTPNKLWPIEAHYRLPFLSYLPLRAANAYLRASGRGHDYEDASYAPTLGSLRRDFDSVPELSWRCVLPACPEATMSGAPLHYRVGMRLIERNPRLWAVSKALLVVARKEG